MAHKYLLGALLAVAAATSQADTLLIENVRQAREAAASLPERGSTMQTVEARFGAPAVRGGPVGEPPITRWEYDGFTVYFEHDRVLHSVLRHSGQS